MTLITPIGLPGFRLSDAAKIDQIIDAINGGVEGNYLGSLLPGTTNAFTLGATGRRWDSAWFGAGDEAYIFNPTIGRKLSVLLGSGAAPDTVLGPAVKVSRVSGHSDDGGASDDGELLAAVVGVHEGTAAMVGQPVGVFGGAKNAGTTHGASGRQPDAVGLYGIGEIVGAGIGYGIGGFFAGRRDAITGNFVSVEMQAENYSGVDGVYASAGLSDTGATWVTAIGTADSAAAWMLGNPTGRQFLYGIAFTGQVAGGKTGGVKLSSIRDDGNSQIILEGRGSHSLGVDLSNGTFSSYPVYLPNAKGIGSKNATGLGSVEIAQVNAFDVVVMGTGANAVYFTPAGVYMPSIPTADPHVSGQLWSNSGVVTRSAG